MILIPLLSFGIYVISCALNVPYNDDEVLLDSINKITSNPTDFPALFDQQNDHRIFFSRVVSLFIKIVSGKMNFRTMIIAGYLNLILLGYAFFLIYKSSNTGLTYFIPVAILLFSPIVYATHLWAITSFEYTLAITFSLFSLLFLQPSKQQIWLWSIPFAMAAAVSNLDGLSVFPVGLVWLIIQKRSRESVYFAIFAIFYLIIFFYGFRFSSASNFPPFPQIFGIVPAAFVSYCGSLTKVISDTHGAILSMIAGSCMLVVFAVINITKFFGKRKWGNAFFPISISEICLLELLACGMMIALGRASDVPGSTMAIRFQIYGVSTFILFYLLILSVLKTENYKRSFFVLFVFVSISLHALSYLKYNNAIAVHNDQLKVDSYNFSTHALFLYQYAENPDPIKAFYTHYEFPVFFSPQEIKNWDKKLISYPVNPQIQFAAGNLNHLPEYQKWIYPVISFQIKNFPPFVPKKDVYLALYNREKPVKPFMIAVRHHHLNWLHKIKKNGLSENSLSVIFPQKMPGRIYDVVLCWKNKGISESILIATNVNLDEVNKAAFPNLLLQ